MVFADMNEREDECVKVNKVYDELKKQGTLIENSYRLFASACKQKYPKQNLFKTEKFEQVFKTHLEVYMK